MTAACRSPSTCTAFAQELYNLVWATAPSQSYAKDGEPPETLARARPESTGAVYRELARLLPLGGGGADGPVRTRFVVDIIGTSAGGINGICLAKALAGEADLSELKNIWVTEGDIGKLINDELSEYPEEPPSSLLSGQRMLAKLIGAITGMAGEAEGDSRLVDELDLWVTATDLEGLEIPIQIANATAHERRHANRYHFRCSTAVDERNDFDGTADGFIAYAARSTSAFPFAFAPVRLEDLSALGNVPDDAWLRFYSAYTSCPRPPFETRSFSDGGIFDNKPFSYATQTLLGCYASLPVDRKVLYVAAGPCWQDRRGRQAAASALERDRHQPEGAARAAQMEHIREDVQTVLDRNRTIERVRDNRHKRRRQRPAEGDARRPQGPADVRRLGRPRHERDGGAVRPAYGVYHQLKVRGVVDYLTALVVRAAGFDPGSDEDFAVHYMVRAWKESRYASEPGGSCIGERVPAALRHAVPAAPPGLPARAHQAACAPPTRRWSGSSGSAVLPPELDAGDARTSDSTARASRRRAPHGPPGRA